MLQQPNIEAYVLPRIEMLFETFKEAKDFYNVYAKHAGFAIREGSKVETRVYLYCTCYGVYESKVSEANRKQNKTTAKTNCGAKMRPKREKDGTLVVKEIVWEHNHRLQLCPQMLVFLHSHKKIDKTILEYVKYLQFKGIEHAQIMSILGGDDPGSYFLKMNAKDLINIKAENSRMDDVDDVLKTVNFFREMKAINREFFCDMQLDESDREHNTQAVRWHIMKKYREHLAYLYNLHEDFKDEFTSILNWSLMPTEFEAAWKGLMDKYNLHDDATMVAMWNERERWISAYFKEIFCAKMTSTQRSESMNYVIKKNFISERQNLHRFVSQKEQNTLTFYGFDTQMAKLYSRAVYSEIRKRLKLSTLFTTTETEEPTKYLVRYNNPQKLFAWSHHAFQVAADPVGEIYDCIFCVPVLCMMQTIKAASVPEKYILRRYTKRPNIQPTSNINDLRTVASNKASQYCIESSLLQLNMRVHRKSLRSQEQMARSQVVMDKLEQELDAMLSAENGGLANNEAVEQDIAAILSEMNHLGAIDPFDNKEEEQQQAELAHVHTQEQQHAHMQDHELDAAVGERHDNRTSYQQQQERVIKPPIFSNTKGRKSKTQPKSRHAPSGAWNLARTANLSG
ncbi:protein FAR1-RELATED SEQUENCE 5-like [Aegilops tauschii subsp. strangulata]|uniref:protein FAR1-RELATED SEQUENCE 5-like n=1 Tax=Aegilops tauschii subsp. strangulata TaxID=200361 RepID=UPI00098AB438|nr:protein FAR-RED ELONGATED HYPOCOTYL 3-like [Aegilops tauschii subsp. strangulata]